MAIKFDTLDKNIASAATDIIEEAEEEFWYSYSNKDFSKKEEEKVYLVKKDELSQIVLEIIREIIEPIKKDVDKIAKKVDILSENVDDLKQDLNGLKTKMDKIYEPTIRERKAAAAARINSDYYNKLEEEANNAIPEGDE